MTPHWVRIVATSVMLVGILSATHAESIRDSVPLLEPTLSAEAQKAYEKIAAAVQEMGYDDAASTVRGWTKGVFGSGTVVRMADGKTYLVTNRHVAAFSDQVKVTFIGVDGTKTVWNDCPVLFFDPRVDLALVAIPDDKTPTGLGLTKAVPEGLEVWSAGFPGLGGKPEWQLAKGNITNGSVSLPDGGPEVDAVFYQHSASIDPGSSGGALVTGDLTKPQQLQLVGINTLTARGRSNAFYAIPAEKVVQSVSRYLEARQESLDSTVDRMGEFLRALEWEKYAYRSLLSYRYGALEGWDAFEQGFQKLATKDRELWGQRFSEGPLDALSQFLSYRLWSKVHESVARLIRGDTDQTKPEAPTTRFTMGDDGFTIRWIREASQWKVLSVEWDSDKKKAEAPVKVDFSAPIPKGIMLRGAAVVPLGTPWASTPGLSFSFDTDSPFVGPVAMTTRVEFAQDSPSKTDYAASPPTERFNFIGYAMGLKYFFNLELPGLKVRPYLGLLAGIDASLPQFYSSISSESADEALGTFLLAGGFEPEIGAEVQVDKYLFLGANVGLRWYAFGLHGIKSVPAGLYIKWVTL